MHDGSGPDVTAWVCENRCGKVFVSIAHDPMTDLDVQAAWRLLTLRQHDAQVALAVAAEREACRKVIEECISTQAYIASNAREALSEASARIYKRNKQKNEMSRLGSLYIELGEPEGELCGCTCEVGDWAADEIRRLRAELDKYRGQVNQYGEDTASDELKVHNKMYTSEFTKNDTR